MPPRGAIPYRTFSADDLCLKTKLVSRNYLSAEFAFVDAAKVRCFSLHILQERMATAPTCASGFYHKDSRHYRLLWKCPLKKSSRKVTHFISCRKLAWFIVLQYNLQGETDVLCGMISSICFTSRCFIYLSSLKSFGEACWPEDHCIFHPQLYLFFICNFYLMRKVSGPYSTGFPFST